MISRFLFAQMQSSVAPSLSLFSMTNLKAISAVLCTICLLPHTPTVRDGGDAERERKTFWMFAFTLKCGKGPIAEQREDKLSRDLPSRSSLGRLDVILFNLSTSPRHKEDRTGLASCHRAVPNIHLCSLTLKYVNYKASAHIELVPNTIYLHLVETKSARETLSCSFSSCELSSLKQTTCFCAALLRVFVWIKAEGPLYLLATVATNTDVWSLLPSEETRWKEAQRKPRNDPNIRLNSEFEGKTRNQSPVTKIPFMSAHSQ